MCARGCSLHIGTCQTIGGVDVQWSKDTSTLTASVTTSTTTGIWIGAGLGSTMVGSSVVIGKIPATGAATYTEHNITANNAAGLGAAVAATTTANSIAAVGGKVVRNDVCSSDGRAT